MSALASMNPTVLANATNTRDLIRGPLRAARDTRRFKFMVPRTKLNSFPIPRCVGSNFPRP